MKISLSAWQYNSSSPRDLRLDLLRGYFVLVMTINHTGVFPAWTQVFTGSGNLWVSAAEGFILVSGVVFGMTYRSRVQTEGWSWSIAKVGNRALLFLALASLWRVLFTTGDYLLRALVGRTSTLSENYLTLLEGAVFQARFSFGAADLLPLYALLLLWGLGAIYLLNQGKWVWVLIGSFLAWHVGRIDPGGYTIFRTYFNPFIWQILFTIGLVAGYYRKQIAARWQHFRPAYRIWAYVLVFFGLVLLVVNYQIMFNQWWANTVWLEQVTPAFNKWFLSIGRIIFSIWVIAAFYLLTTWLWKGLNGTLGWLLLPLGQHALIAYLLQDIMRYVISRLPNYPFPNHDTILAGFLHLGIVLLVWGFTLLLVNLTNFFLSQLKLHQRPTPANN